MKIGTQSASMVIRPPAIMTGVDHFLVKVQGSSPSVQCTIKANADPLECDLTLPMPASKYIVNSYSCLVGLRGCSPPTEGTFWTHPMRK